jgi:hypothetical protein
MPMLVATDRKVVVMDVDGGRSQPAHGISGRPTCLSPDTLVLDGRDVGVIVMAYSGATMADGPGGRSALPAG